MGIKMAKASEADLEMAMDLTTALGMLSQRWCPTMPEACEVLKGPDAETEPFDRDDDEQCGRALRHVLNLLERGSLMRVVWGMKVLLDPRNKIVDPAADTLEHHPEITAAQQRQAEYRNWMLLAFRAVNDADGVLSTVVPESLTEEAALTELRERLQALARHVPVLLGMGHAQAVHEAEKQAAPVDDDGPIETSEADARPYPALAPVSPGGSIA